MSKKINEKLSKVLDIEPISFTEVVEAPQENIQGQIENDSDFARKNIVNLIEKGNNAIDHLLRVAIESEHPRAYEVASGLIKNLSDLNKDLLQIQKTKKELLPKPTENNNLNIDKAVFVGSTTDLIKMLKQSKKEH